MSRRKTIENLTTIVEMDSPKISSNGIPAVYSPITQIVQDLSKSSLCENSPVCTPGKRKIEFVKQSPGRNIAPFERNQQLFKNVFKIKGTPDGTVKSRVKGRRLLSMASRRISSPEPISPSVDKENGSAPCSPIVLNSSPQKIVNKMKLRCPLEDCDPNSQDSGYGASYPDDLTKSHDGFRFTEPSGVAPRRMSIDSNRDSPLQSPVRSSPQRIRRPGKSLIKKLSSSGYESMDDGFNDLNDIELIDMENSEMLPNGLNDLISGHINSANEKPMECDAATTPEFARTKPHILRRSLSLQNERQEKCSPPPMSKIRACLFRSPNATSSASKLTFDDKPRSIYNSIESPPIKSFKRPDPPTDASPVLVKKSKRSCSMREFPETVPTVERKHIFQRSFTDTEAHANIKSAIHRSTTDSDLTGDFSKPCILPLAEGQHEDLKSISAETLAGVMRGEFNDYISSYKIVDCRYPYEYEAGHIEGAVNLYTKELIEEHLMQPLTQTPEIQPDSNLRNIIVFHCEFSWERGPNLSRYLRNIDRNLNKECYPALHYPEIYLLHGGYKLFFRDQQTFCSPQGYRPMNDPDHDADLRKFRSKSKSWQGEKSRANGLPSKANLKRLGF